MSDFKLAADAIRSLAVFKDRALKAETKLAEYERKERVESLKKLAAAKQAELPRGIDLMKCPETKLAGIEQALELLTPKGEIKLAEVEEPQENTSTKKASALEEYLLHPDLY